jgi:(E)-4-hydroxy-3-methylbut-2-enyl-diphosphate synthase
MLKPRRKTRPVQVGPIKVGGGAPISVQSMTKTDTRDADGTIAQIRQAAEAGVDIMRVTVPDEESAEAMRRIVAESPVPIIADIHFDYRMALRALEAGVACLRLNPGNIGSEDRVRKVVERARDQKVPIRIGVNAGSLERQFLRHVEDGKMSVPEAMRASALHHFRILEDLDFRDIKVSMKASDVLTTIQAYELLAEDCPYPFHVGITEAGTQRQGTIKSAVGIGYLAMQGLCDTIRVSLCAEPHEEVYVGRQILQSIGQTQPVGEVVACPTCGRLEIDMLPITDMVEERLQKLQVPIKVAIMGCAVNGPGEAKGAHIGIAAGRSMGALYRDGEFARKLEEREIIPVLMEEIDRWAADWKAKHPDAGPSASKLGNRMIVPSAPDAPGYGGANKRRKEEALVSATPEG